MKGVKTDNLAIGAQGEEIAVSFLKGRKYAILGRNFRIRGGEVDIVARDGRTIVFVEVKARRGSSYGAPQEAVTPFKQRQIARAAMTWLVKNHQTAAAARFDVIAVLLHDGAEPTIEHIKNAFELPN